MSKVVCRLIFAALDAAWPTAWLESLGTIFHATLRDVHLVGLTGEFSFLSALQVYTYPLTETLRRTRNGIIRTSPTSNSSSSDFSSTFPLGGSAGGTCLWLRGPQSTHLLTTSVGWGCGVWMGVRPGSFIYSCDNRCQFIRFYYREILFRSSLHIPYRARALPNVLQAHGMPNNLFQESNTTNYFNYLLI